LRPLREQLARAEKEPNNVADLEINIDLKQCTIQWPMLDMPIKFDIDPFWQECLLKGVDEIALTLGYLEHIERFEQSLQHTQPWLRP
jgi:3-isopropylmalate dehydratase small subunit